MERCGKCMHSMVLLGSWTGNAARHYAAHLAARHRACSAPRATNSWPLIAPVFTGPCSSACWIALPPCMPNVSLDLTFVRSVRHLAFVCCSIVSRDHLSADFKAWHCVLKSHMQLLHVLASCLPVISAVPRPKSSAWSAGGTGNRAPNPSRPPGLPAKSSHDTLTPDRSDVVP